ncbi:MAG: HAD family hydrolase [Clostridia bacterium]|nr:HAD family hydrolase [Clostridia bacterium]
MNKTVIFDLDGTLLNTLSDLADSMNESLRILGFSGYATEKYRYFVGNGVRELARGVLPEGKKDDESIDRLLKIYNGIYTKNQFNKTAPYDNIKEAVTALKEKGFSVWVLSNKPDPNTKMIAAHYFGDLFDGVMGQSDAFPRKPDPAAALHILERTETAPENAFFVGDSSTDMKTAKAAGVTAVGVTWGFRDEPELLENGADIIAHAPLDLPDLIKF